MWSQDFVMRKELAMLYEIQAIGFPVFAHNKEESVPYASGGPGAVGNNADGSIIFERVHQFYRGAAGVFVAGTADGAKTEFFKQAGYHSAVPV